MLWRIFVVGTNIRQKIHQVLKKKLTKNFSSVSQKSSFVTDSQLNSAFYVLMSTNNLEDILPASKNIAWCIVIEEQIEINDLKSPFDDWYLKFRKTKFNKNIFMERLISVIILILNIICSVYRCNTSIACLNWISELIRFIFYDE